MWMLFALSSLAMALAALRFTLFSDTKGWADMDYLGMYLVVWLPLVSIVTLALVCGLAARNGWRWTMVAALSFMLGAVQFSLIMHTNSSRLANSFLPAVLLGLSVMALNWRNQVSAWPGPLLVGIGLLALGGAFGARAIERRRDEAARAERAAVESRKEATLRDLGRAAWLLQREFFMGDYDESRFLQTRCYREPRSQGEYRWDEQRQRLMLTRPLFVELWRREQIMPHAERALRTESLRPGPRADLGGGILQCHPPLDCTVTWEFDVNRMHPYDRALLPEVAAIEAGAWKEVTSAGQ